MLAVSLSDILCLGFRHVVFPTQIFGVSQCHILCLGVTYLVSWSEICCLGVKFCMSRSDIFGVPKSHIWCFELRYLVSRSEIFCVSESDIWCLRARYLVSSDSDIWNVWLWYIYIYVQLVFRSEILKVSQWDTGAALPNSETSNFLKPIAFGVQELRYLTFVHVW